MTDSDGDGRADRFDAVSAEWGYEHYHEYAFGTGPDANGDVYVALGLSSSYYSRALFRGWVLKIAPDGDDPGRGAVCAAWWLGGRDANDQLFYMESQGPWNSSCSLFHHEGLLPRPSGELQLVPLHPEPRRGADLTLPTSSS